MALVRRSCLLVSFIAGALLPLGSPIANAQTSAEPEAQVAEPAAPAEATQPAAIPTDYSNLPPLEDSGSRAPFEGERVPSGIFLDGGLAVFAGGGGGGKAWFRMDLGIPVLTLAGGAGNLAVQLPLFVTREKIEFVDFEQKWVGLGITPGVTYEHSLTEEAGRLSVYGEFGGGVFLTFIDVPDMPFMPGGTETDVQGAIRIAAGVRYTFPFGLFASLQPIGVLAVFAGDSGGAGRYDFALTVGYRFD